MAKIKIDESTLSDLNDDPTLLGQLKDKAISDIWAFAEANPDVPLAGTLRQDLAAAAAAIAANAQPEADPQSPETAANAQPEADSQSPETE